MDDLHRWLVGRNITPAASYLSLPNHWKPTFNLFIEILRGGSASGAEVIGIGQRTVVVRRMRELIREKERETERKKEREKKERER